MSIAVERLGLTANQLRNDTLTEVSVTRKLLGGNS